jgi:3-oxoacyl-[acyl-carrier-protein] synthase-1
MESHLFINGYGICTSTSANSREFTTSLFNGVKGSRPVDISKWPVKAKGFWNDQEKLPLACLMNKKENVSIADLISDRLLKSFHDITNFEEIIKTKNLGVIFASTKGSAEDIVWKEETLTNGEEIDPLRNVLDKFLEKSGLAHVEQKTCVSNSCASSHAALYMAKNWIEAKYCEKVLVVASDYIGPFIMTGFKTLRALSETTCLPFSENRDGLVLGEAACSMLLSAMPGEFEIKNISIKNEAHTVTAPSNEGRGLYDCVKDVTNSEIIDLVIAHGTGTVANDKVEDAVFSRLETDTDQHFPVTATKWSVGHTLGASGLVDAIAALSCMKENRVYGIKGFGNENELKCKNYLSENVESILNTVLITSLGFGGTNGALVIKRCM